MAPPAHSSRTSSQRKVRGLPRKVSSGANSEPSPAKNRKHKGKAKATAEEYPLRSILDENENSYLIDWEDNPRTGESYEPTWEPKSNANETAIADWEQKKLKKSTTVIADSQSGPSAVETSQDSQPIRSAKRKRERQESPVLSEPLRKRKASGFRNKSEKLQAGFGRKVPELELEGGEGELVPTIVEDEVGETNQEDRTFTSGDSIQVPVNQEKSTKNLGGFPILSNASSDGFIHEQTHHNNTFSPTPSKIKAPTKRDIVPDSQETPISADNAGLSSQDHQLSSGQVDSQARTEGSETVFVADEEESWEEPPSYRERAKYLEAEGIDNPSGSSSYSVNEQISYLPQTPGRDSTEGLQEEVPTDIFQEPDDEPGSSNHSQVCASDSEPIVPSLEQLTPSPAPSPVDPRDVADDPELPIPLQIEDDVDPDLVPALVDTPGSIDQETDETDDLQFQTQVLYTAHSVNDSIQSTQEKPSSHESAISVARSSPARSPAVESSEPWQGGQVVPQVDPISSESSHYQSFNPSREFEPITREQQVARESFTPPPAVFSHRQTSQTPSQLNSYEDIPTAPQPFEHGSLFQSDRVIASVEEEFASPTFPPPHLIPSSGTPQFPETYGDDFPSRPDTLSNDNMEGNASSIEQNALAPLSISERLRQIRAQSSTHMSTRSPSAIPERIPTPPTAHPGQMLPSKQHHIEPEESFAVVQPPLETVVEDNADISEVQPPSEVSRARNTEHRVLLPMVAFVRDVYAQAVKNCKAQIKDFISASNVDSAITESIDNLIDDLRKCSTHQDLLSEPSATQAATPDHVTAKWADTCSTKCIFLRHFLNESRGLETHVVILARPGKTLDIIESILKTDNISYDRPGDHAVAPISSIMTPLKITLVPTGEEGGQYVVPRADMVIGFDDTFDSSEDYVHRLRADLYGDKLAPLVSLIIVNSVEHINFSIPRQVDAHTRKSVLVSCIAHTVREHEVGVAHPEDPSPDTCATRVSQYLADGAQNWPLAPLPEAAAVEIYLGESTQDSAEQTDNPVQEESGSTTQSHDTGAQVELQVPQSSLKRSWDISDEDGDNAKRLRATPQPEGGSSAESTRISDTTVDPSQIFSAPAEHKASLDIRSRHEKPFDDSPNSWQARISELEEQLRSKTNAELQLRADNERIRAENLQLRKDVAGHENGVRIMQPKFLEALHERAAAVHEAKLATEKLATISSRLEARVAEVTKLKENEARLETELAATRQALTTSAIPEIAELEKAHALAREYLEEKNKVERKLENKEKDFNFTRNSYQESSSKCGELSTALSELKEQNAILARQADENRVAINQINHAQALDFHVQRINQLQNILEDREDELQRKSEELKVLKEGRRGTRGTSAPKSPMFSTGVHSPKVAGNRSRGASPNVGDLGSAGTSGGRDPVSFLSGGGTARFAPLSRLRE